nr:mediator of rna polymerase ii transcription subunit 16 [Quercus suber]
MAAVDDIGCVHLYMLSGTLGRMQAASSDITGIDSANHLDTVVGLHWLSLRSKSGSGVSFFLQANCGTTIAWNMRTLIFLTFCFRSVTHADLANFQVYHVDSALKKDGQWVASVRTLEPPRVQHPDGRNALLYVTRLGRLSLLFQTESGAWQSTSHDLEICASTENLLSHAALGEHTDHLLLTTHDTLRRLRLFKVTILWNPAPTPRGGVAVNPTVTIGHLATVERLSPQHSDSARLTHLRILPPIPPEPNQPHPSAPDILAVFTHVPSPDAPQAQQDGFNVIARWNVQSVVRNLHECFSKQKAARKNSTQDLTTVLSRATDMITNKVVIALEAQSSNTIVAFAASDGSVDFHDRANFIKILPFGETTMVTSLAASGFEHLPGEHRSHIAMSPDACVLVSATGDGSIDARTMTNKYGWQLTDDGNDGTRSLVEASIVCVARQYNALCYISASNDEPLAILPDDLNPVLRVFLIKQILNMIGNKPGPGPDICMLDVSKQQMTVLRDLSVARALSAQLALGTRSNSDARNFEGQFAYIVLNLRTMGMSLAQIMGKSPDVGRPDLAPTLVSMVRWVCNLMIWVLASILTATREATSGTLAVETLQQLATSSGNPAIHLLLCSHSRILLRFHSLYIQTYVKLATAMLPRCQSVVDRQQLIDVLEMTTKLMPFQLKTFQDLITDFDNSVRKAYTETSTTPEKRTNIELRMITEGYVPMELSGALQALVNIHLPSMCEHVDMGRLFFWDTQWLNITHVMPERGSTCYDAIQKFPLTRGMSLRTCRKCGSQMEDIPNEQLKTMPVWLIHSTRSCICLNFWWLA